MEIANSTPAHAPFVSRNARPKGWMPSEKLDLRTWGDLVALHGWARDTFPDPKGVVDDPLPTTHRASAPIAVGGISALQQPWALVLRVSRNMGVDFPTAEAVLRAQVQAHRARTDEGPEGEALSAMKSLRLIAADRGITPSEEEISEEAFAQLGDVGLQVAVHAAFYAWMGTVGAPPAAFLAAAGGAETRKRHMYALPCEVDRFLAPLDRLGFFENPEQWIENAGPQRRRALMYALSLLGALIEGTEL